ncbi:MAG: bifunctional DNA-formamidopyrimidine glycosylase/DNA-(apurinic or apyrimidinic site) lyase [Burkholderiales bacterium]|nr:MAG: bifunctional DNA-formamidopyrimidine glycosylase/DNA-(apurinic or apyrimidinic site) lyase [Betaproteobacteria bacterium]TAG84339.1 MAG: bifunctional DNA-formamidopyrimidine glycosylase/DNA-(apurinic or apyrimidinic site) lyase [Burkholderiales bacterium]
MPELPEVETVRRGLSSEIVGRTITGVAVRERRLRWPIAENFETRLVGKRIDAIERRSKYLLVRLMDDALRASTLLAHLGMTGSFVVNDERTASRIKPHDHVDLILDSGAIVRYNDPRRFGSMHVFDGPDSAQPLLAQLGPEPLTDALDGRYLFDQTRRRPGPIKQAIMDNHLVVGVGNIYANESLFRAGIHPNRAANRISKQRYDQLVHEIKAVLSEAINAGGSTLRDYVNASGEPGYFQLNYFVYGRDGEACRRCKSALKLARHGGRATVYCAKCQR